MPTVFSWHLLLLLINTELLKKVKKPVCMT